MRKIILIFAIIALFTSCKPNEKMLNYQSNTSSIMLRTEPCRDLKDFDAIDKNELELRAEWLRRNGDKVCEVILFDAIETAHTTVNPNSKNSPYEISWSDLNAFVGPNFYNAYLAFNLDSKNNVSGLKLIPKFTINEPSYSIPLFRHLVKKYGLTDSEKIEFVNVPSEQGNKIYIKVKNNFYYDYSEEPKNLLLRTKTPL